MNRIGLNLFVPLLLVLSGLLVFWGCDDNLNVCDPPIPAGRIQGRVKTGDVPYTAEIQVTRFDENGGRDTRFSVEPDSTGYYALDLPAGRYIVQLVLNDSYRTLYDYTATGPGFGQGPPDTLVVDDAHSPSGIDFILGGLTLDLELSHHLDGEGGDVYLHRRDFEADGWRTIVDRGRADIENGRLSVTIPGVLPGDYQVEIVLGARDYLCYCPYDGEHFWMPGTRDRDASPWYSVAADSAVHLEATVTTDPARIEGRVTGAWLEMGLTMKPILSIFNPDSVSIMGGREVEDDGSFGFDIHLPGPVKLLVRQKDLEQWIGGPDFASATVFDLALGQTISGIELEQCGIHFVMDDIFGLSWENEFRIYDSTGSTHLTTMVFDGGSSSHVGIPNLWPGEFLVRLEPGGEYLGGVDWKAQWWDRADHPGQARVITLGAAGEIAGGDFILENGGSISGIVNSSLPVERFYVVYGLPADGQMDGPVYRAFNYNGYKIRGIHDGQYKLGVLHQNEVFAGPATPGMVWYPGTSDWNEAQILEITAAGDLTGIDFDLP